MSAGKRLCYLFCVYLNVKWTRTGMVKRQFSWVWWWTDEPCEEPSTPLIQKHIQPPNSSSLVSHDELNEHLAGKVCLGPLSSGSSGITSPSETRSWWSNIHHQIEARGDGERGREKRKQNRDEENEEKSSDDDWEQSRWSWERVSQRIRDGRQLLISKATAIVEQRREKRQKKRMNSRRETQGNDKSLETKAENNKHISTQRLAYTSVPLINKPTNIWSALNKTHFAYRTLILMSKTGNALHVLTLAPAAAHDTCLSGHILYLLVFSQSDVGRQP